MRLCPPRAIRGLTYFFGFARTRFGKDDRSIFLEEIGPGQIASDVISLREIKFVSVTLLP